MHNLPFYQLRATTSILPSHYASVDVFFVVASLTSSVHLMEIWSTGRSRHKTEPRLNLLYVTPDIKNYSTPMGGCFLGNNKHLSFKTSNSRWIKILKKKKISVMDKGQVLLLGGHFFYFK